jgi:hypothetical protein
MRGTYRRFLFCGALAGAAAGLVADADLAGGHEADDGWRWCCATSLLEAPEVAGLGHAFLFGLVRDMPLRRPAR